MDDLVIRWAAILLSWLAVVPAVQAAYSETPYGIDWLYPSATTYAMGPGDNGRGLSAFNAGGTLTITLPPNVTTLFPAWHMCAVNDAGHGVTINVNATAGGHILLPGPSPSSVATISTAAGNYEMICLIYDTAGNFRVNWASPLTENSLGMLPSGMVSYWTLSGVNLYNNSGTNVGINTTGPGAALDVHDTAAGGTEQFHAGALLGGYVLAGFDNGNNRGRLAAYSGGYRPLLLNQGGGPNAGVSIGTTASVNTLEGVGDGTGVFQLGTAGCGGNYSGLTLGQTAQASSCTNYNVLSSWSDPNLYLNRPSGQTIRFRQNNLDEFVLTVNHHPEYHGGSPAPSGNCGAGAIVAGNDVVGRVTTGTGTASGQCTIIFATTWSFAPVCNVWDETTGTALYPGPAVSALTINTVSGNIPVSHNIGFSCVGYQ